MEQEVLGCGLDPGAWGTVVCGALKMCLRTVGETVGGKDVEAVREWGSLVMVVSLGGVTGPGWGPETLWASWEAATAAQESPWVHQWNGS